MQERGRVKTITALQSGQSKAGKDWSKKELIIETDGQYPKMIAATFFGDKVQMIEKLREGDLVDLDFNVESREWNGKWFHNINGDRVDIVVDQSPQQSNSNWTEPTVPDDDSLPF